MSAAFQVECEEIKNMLRTSSEEIENLKNENKWLQNRLAEEVEAGRKSRISLNAISDLMKQHRRQRLHDFKQLFEELEEHKHLGAMSESQQRADDVFMDIDEDMSDMSTPSGHRKSDITQVKIQLASCAQKLEYLKAKYRELEKECATCFMYLHERDAQCSRLMNEKTALEKQFAELERRTFEAECRPRFCKY